jgi:hypothetical protein
MFRIIIDKAVLDHILRRSTLKNAVLQNLRELPNSKRVCRPLKPGFSAGRW